MAMTQAALLEEALALPEEERATLADRLFASLDEPAEAEIEAAWVEVAQQRMAAYRRGETASHPAEQVLVEAQESPRTMKCELLTEAKHELAEAVDHYDGEQPGLGDEFVAAVGRGLEAIQRHPFAWKRVLRATRVYRVERFPYQLIYEVEGGTAYILAVAHVRRRPFYWRGRR